MTYTQGTQDILGAVMRGEVCAECGAPNHLRHFDECPQHPENSE